MECILDLGQDDLGELTWMDRLQEKSTHGILYLESILVV